LKKSKNGKVKNKKKRSKDKSEPTKQRKVPEGETQSFLVVIVFIFGQLKKEDPERENPSFVEMKTIAPVFSMKTWSTHVVYSG